MLLNAFEQQVETCAAASKELSHSVSMIGLMAYKSLHKGEPVYFLNIEGVQYRISLEVAA